MVLFEPVFSHTVSFVTVSFQTMNIPKYLPFLALSFGFTLNSGLLQDAELAKKITRTQYVCETKLNSSD